MANPSSTAHEGVGVSLVDGEPAIRRARQLMLRSEHYDVRSYAACEALLADRIPRMTHASSSMFI